MAGGHSIELCQLLPANALTARVRYILPVNALTSRLCFIRQAGCFDRKYRKGQLGIRVRVCCWTFHGLMIEFLFSGAVMFSGARSE